MHLYRRSKTGPWWFELEYGGTRFRESTGEGDQREATRVARKRSLEIQAGEPDFRKRRREARLVDLLAKELAEAETRELAPGYQKALATYHGHLTEFFGRDSTLADITYDTVREFERWRREEHSVRGQSIREEVSCLKRAFIRARRMKLVRAGLDEWPVIRSDRKSESRSGKLVPLEVLAAVLNALDDDVREELHFTVLTGLRKEELPEIRWSWVRKARGRTDLLVPDTSRKAGDTYAIPLPPDAAKIISERHMRMRDQVDVALFPARDWRKRIAKAVTAAGATHLTYRDLRATYARMIERRGGALVARDSLGHSEIDTTNLYLEATLEDRRTAATEIAAELRAAMRGKKTAGRRK